MKFFLFSFLLLTTSASFAQQQIFATISGGNLYSFDLTSCTRHLVGSPGYGFGDISFTSDGRLWGILSGKLYQIDTTNANATLAGTIGFVSNNLVELNDSVLLTERGKKLYGINVNTLASYYIDTIGYFASGDLAWYDNDLYIVTSQGLLIKMVLNSTNTALVSVSAVNTSGNPIPSCLGAVTTSFTGSPNYIIGFSGADLIKICQIDGSYQMLCPALNVGGSAGAAALRLQKQFPEPISCAAVITGDNKVSSNSLISLFPNPANSELTIQTNEKFYAGFSIYNTLGQQVMTGPLERTTNQINISNLYSGVYYIELSAGNKTERNRFIVEK